MVVLRRLDDLLEPTKDKVREEVNFQKNELKLVELDDPGFQDAAGYGFYNVSKWTLKGLKETATNNPQILLANIEEYLGALLTSVYLYRYQWSWVNRSKGWRNPFDGYFNAFTNHQRTKIKCLF